MATPLRSAPIGLPKRSGNRTLHEADTLYRPPNPKTPARSENLQNRHDSHALSLLKTGRAAWLRALSSSASRREKSDLRLPKNCSTAGADVQATAPVAARLPGLNAETEAG